MRLPDEKILGVLNKNKVITNKEGEDLIAKADEQKVSLFDYVIGKDLIDRDKLGRMVAKDFGVNYIDLSKTTVDPEVLKLMPEIVAKKSVAVVFGHDKNGVHLAVNDPEDKDFIKNFSKRVDDEVVVYFADMESLGHVLNQFAAQVGDEDLEKLIRGAGEGEGSQGKDLPVIKIVDRILALSYNNKASDIHIEPFDEVTYIRFRIDGILHDIISIPKNLEDLIVTRIKILARLRTDEHRAAQDGRLRFVVDGAKVDVRVSIVPVIHGEKIVMRLLSERSRQYDLENLGFSPADLKKIQNNIDKPWGMILATGPTGSGKTTTLYAILKKLYSREVNISTIEDPVEYDMEGINQIQVNAATNLTFSDGLRAIVRQDPDIIMVGEIRDQETASIAINSAMTGHLVLSTLHTNDAPTTLPRLLDMGIKSFLVASTVNIVVGQRLVRKICTECKYQTHASPETIKYIEKQLSSDIIKKFKLLDKSTQFSYGKGCANCQNTGFKGRQGIYEIMDMTEELKALIMERANASIIRAKAIEQGMTTMVEDGIRKLLEGITTVEEVLRVTRE